jgi:DNA-cytosine methyltransferase
MKKLIKIGSQFSGVGAFEQALNRLCVEYKNIYAADWDKYARQTYLLNFEEPEYYIKDVNDTPIEQITQKHGSLDLAMFSPPCQAFSLAGKRKGEDDKRGILFYNSHEFIVKNKPRYFIIENVKGLLSDDSGKTFQRWIDYLAGKSVNGNPVIFPHEEAAPYHVYYQVLNAKHYGVPQNRERIFIIGIRDDEDNNFSFPKPFPLEKRLKDVLQPEVDEKYFLSDKSIQKLTTTNFNQEASRLQEKEICDTLLSRDCKGPKCVQIGTWRTHEDGKGFRATEDNMCPTIPARAREDGSGKPVIKVVAFGRSEEEKLRRKKVFQETGKDSGSFKDKNLILKDQEYYDTLLASPNPQKEGLIAVEEPKILGYTRDSKGNVVSRHEKDEAGTIHTSSGGGGNTDQFVIIPTNNSKGFDVAEEENWIQGGLQANQPKQTNGISPCLTSAMGMGGGQTPIHNYQQRIRRLTPLECFNLMDFNPEFKWEVSDSQAYKQAGNSIVVSCLVEIIKKLKM